MVVLDKTIDLPPVTIEKPRITTSERAISSAPPAARQLNFAAVSSPPPPQSSQQTPETAAVPSRRSDAADGSEAFMRLTGASARRAFMRPTGASARRSERAKADAAWLAHAFGVPPPQLGPQVVGPYRLSGMLGERRRAWAYAEVGEREDETRRPRVLMSAPGGRQEEDAAALRTCVP